MPWQERLLMDQRVQFIADDQRDVFSVAELADRFGISRTTAYKWLDRYPDSGPAGLINRSQRPKSCPHQTAADLVAAIVEVRRRHPTWGPKKLLRILTKRPPRWPWPARSTTAELLRRQGLVRTSRRRRALTHPGRPLTPMTAPHAIWTADFKGQFRTRNGISCYPLTIVDGFSRYVLACQALRSTEIALAKPVFLRLFQEYGLPQRIRTDNGVPFATTALGQLPRCRSGGFDWALCRSSSSPRTRNRTGATSACTHVESGAHAAALRQSAGPASPLHSLPARVHRRAPARGGAPRHARVALRRVGAVPAASIARDRIHRAL